MTSVPALKDAEGKLNALRAELKSVFDEAGPDLNLANIKSISGDKIAWIRGKNDEITKMAEEVKGIREVAGIAESARKEFFEAGGIEDYKERGTVKGMTLGEAFTKSRAYKDRAQNATDLVKVELKDIFSEAGGNFGTYSGENAAVGWPPESTRSGKVLLTATRPEAQIVNYFPTSAINQTAYKYMEETVFGAVMHGTEADGTTAQTDDGSGLPQEINEGDVFTQAKLALVERSKTVEKLGVWIPMTDEQLEDIEGAQAYVNQRLTSLMHLRVDLQLLRGDGNTPNLLGTENVSGILTQAKGSDNVPDAFLKLINNIRTTAFAEPSVAFIHPLKWQDVQLMKTADGQYIWNHPSTTGPATLWGVPVVPTTVVSSSKIVTGDYSTHAAFMVKRGLEMQVTNAHSDYFVRGKQALRMDMRALAVHFRPTAFGTVTGL